jgi:hypothetical protein
VEEEREKGGARRRWGKRGGRKRLKRLGRKRQDKGREQRQGTQGKKRGETEARVATERPGKGGFIRDMPAWNAAKNGQKNGLVVILTVSPCSGCHHAGAGRAVVPSIPFNLAVGVGSTNKQWEVAVRTVSGPPFFIYYFITAILPSAICHSFRLWGSSAIRSPESL